MTLPSVSILIPNLNGQQLLVECLAAVAALDYPRDRTECIVVDNASSDGSVYYVRSNFPDVKVVTLTSNSGFAGAVNKGAECATGDVLFLLNNDARPEPDVLTALVDPIESGEADCTCARIVSSENGSVQFAGGGMNFHGVAFECAEESGSQARPCLFGCGGAMAVRRDVFLDAGGMDDSFFAYFEDVDLGWRLWIMGYRVLYVPRAMVSHRKSSTSRFIETRKLRVLHIRNPLIMVYKNYENEYLRRILPAALILTLRRTSYLGDFDETAFRIGRESHLAESTSANHASRGSPPKEAKVELPAVAVSDFVAMNDWITMLPDLDDKRHWIQGRRKRRDTEIARMFVDPFRYCEDRADYRALQDNVCRTFGINELFAETHRDTGARRAPV